jgi:hypothetical protein
MTAGSGTGCTCSRLLASYACSTAGLVFSCAHTMPLLLPFAEIAGAVTDHKMPDRAGGVGQVRKQHLPAAAPRRMTNASAPSDKLVM